MATHLNRINFPELFFGFVAPIGANTDVCVRAFAQFFSKVGYRIIQIKVTDTFTPLASRLEPIEPLDHRPRTFERYDSYIRYGNQIRAHFEDDAILASISCAKAAIARTRLPKDDKTTEENKQEGNLYLIRQFKRKEEVALLRSVYGRLFFQVSVYSRRGARVDHLARQFAHSDNVGNHNLYRGKAENIVQIDESESDDDHGQEVSAIFHDADIVINTDEGEASIQHQVTRFCELLFGSNKISPTKYEYGMFAAKAAALRTLDLSRQVGAAIFTEGGEIVSMGSNEVPKAGGGTYWSDSKNNLDDRDYVRGYDANEQLKRERLAEVIKLLKLPNADNILKREDIRKSQFMDALEFSRVIHAEMSAISDAARLGFSLRGTTLFCTTFPCHMCAKHIIAAGIAKVVFLEPYPKSLTSDLHGDAVTIEGADRGRYQHYPYVDFDHFYGISPRRYREMFERTKRKDDDGKFIEWNLDNKQRPIIDLKFPFYTILEQEVLRSLDDYLKTLKMTFHDLDPNV